MSTCFVHRGFLTQIPFMFMSSLANDSLFQPLQIFKPNQTNPKTLCSHDDEPQQGVSRQTELQLSFQKTEETERKNGRGVWCQQRVNLHLPPSCATEIKEDDCKD